MGSITIGDGFRFTVGMFAAVFFGIVGGAFIAMLFFRSRVG